MANPNPPNLSFLQTSRILAGQMVADTKTYIARLYGRLGEMFTAASPYSQIIDVINEIGELIFYYIENSTVEQNIYTAQQPESIYGLARLAGHDPYRGASSVGEIAVRLNAGSINDIAGDALNIPANSKIQSNSNGLYYLLKTSADQFRIDKTNANYVYIPIIQGTLESQTVTGTGLALQSFNILINGNADHDNITVSVNGQKWTKFDSLYDMLPTDTGFLAKTGISGGIDIYFGNGSFGMIPDLGTTIIIEYVITAGSIGNLVDSKDLTFKFIDQGFDSTGTSYDLNLLLDSTCTVAPRMGADPEDINLTKLIAPLASKSFVLATPDNFEYFLAKYGMFSYIDAYTTTADGSIDDDNIIYLFMLPDVNKRLTSNQDYFSIDQNEFFFSQDMNNAILGVIENSGQQMINSEIKIVDPIVKYYRMDIKVKYFEGYSTSQLFNVIRGAVSQYLLTITRRDSLPKSDLIAIIEAIEGIDSVNIRFVSQDEEDARRNGYYTVTTTITTPSTPILTTDGSGQQSYVFFKKTTQTTTVNIAENDPLPESIIGMDSFGDIILQPEEVALFRGGWLDRNGAAVIDDARTGEMAAMTVYFDNPPIPSTIFSALQTQNRKAL